MNNNGDECQYFAKPSNIIVKWGNEGKIWKLIRFCYSHDTSEAKKAKFIASKVLSKSEEL
jgi:hypothetical protein